MKIALHMATLRGFGSGAIGQNLLRAFPQVSGVHRFVAWIPDVWPLNATEGLDRIVFHRVRPGSLSKFITENWTIRHALRSGVADAILSLGDTSLPCPVVPSVLFVQQAFLAYDTWGWDQTLPPRLRFNAAMMAAYFRLGVAGVTHFVVQTQDMKTRLCRRWSIAPERVSVIPSAIAWEWDALADEPVRESIFGPALLCCPTTWAPYKNLRVLVPMMEDLARKTPNIRLALTVTKASVPEFVKAAQAHGVMEQMIFLGELQRNELIQLVARSAVVVLPSLLESFGLAYYEAAAAGTPVVAADREFAREALGSAGFYAPAHDGCAWAALVEPLLDNDAKWRQASRAIRSQYLANRRTWANVAQDFIRLVERCA